MSLRVDALRCPRTHSGRRPCRQDGRCTPSAFHGRPRTGRAGGVFPGLTRGAESGVHPCVPAGALGGFPGRGAGKADALMTKAVRESVTMVGRAERARVARVFTAGVPGPGHPCADDAALLVSCSATASGTAARARRGRRSRSGPPAVWSGSTSPTGAAGECRSCGPPVMRRRVSGGWVGPAWDARPAAARPQSHGAALGSQHPWLRHCAPEAPASLAPGPSTGRSGE